MLSKLHRNLFTIRIKKVFAVIEILPHAFLMIPNIAFLPHFHTQGSIFFASRVVQDTLEVALFLFAADFLRFFAFLPKLVAEHVVDFLSEKSSFDRT